MEEDYYEARMDELFGKGTMWNHRTLRTVFDPLSSEWEKTSIIRKCEIIETCIQGGENLSDLIMDYKMRYREQNRSDIANSVESALIAILTYKFNKG